MNKTSYLSYEAKILMADNTWLPIEKIKIGDYVNSLGEKEKVKNIFQSRCDELFVITTNSGRKISATPEQKFRIEGIHNVETRYINIGDTVLCFNEDDLFAETITDITKVFPIDKRVYNLELSENHNYCANGFLCLDYKYQKDF